MLDLDAYLARIGLQGSASIAELHRAHVAAIPFENLDPHGGIPVSLEPADLERKMVAERRGGYCFEQNLLFKAALEALGAEVETMLARVRVGAPPGALRPRSHLVLRVRTPDGILHADVGFGRGTLLEPIPFGPSGEHDQAGWQFRVVREDDQLVLQTLERREWVDLYGFVPEPVPFVDLVTSNWYTCTNPRSPFVTGLTVSLQAPDGTRTTLNNWNALELSVQTPAGTRIRPVAVEEVPALLAERFGLTGFVVRADGRIGRAKAG